MAKATKSKLNSKMPSVSRIAFAKAVNSTTEASAIATKSGTWSVKVRYKQGSKKYPFQAQWRSRKFYTTDLAKTKGDCTAWSMWKSVASTRTDSPNTWMKSNVGINRKSSFQIAKTFTNQKIGASYRKAQIEVRIRTFNKSKAQHGSWTTKRLTVYRKDSITNEKIHKGVNGGAYVDFNISTYSSGKIVITKLKDSKGRNLLTTSKSLSRGITKRTSSYGYISIPSKYLKRELRQGEALDMAAYFISDIDNIKTNLTIKKVDSAAASITPSMSISYDDTSGTVVVQGEDIASAFKVGCSCSYTYKGKEYTIKYDRAADNAYYFTPPLATDLTFKMAALDSSFNYACTTKNYKATMTGYVFNSLTTPKSYVAVAWGEPSLTVESTAQIAEAHPYGADKDLVFYGTGTSTKLTFAAKILNKTNQVGGESAAKAAWDELRNNPGVYRFRTNKGDMYVVAITSVSTSSEKYNIYNLNVNMVEVSYE